MSYTHLTRDERYQIYILKRAGHAQSEIALLMNRHKSTISREMARNSGQRGYRPAHADMLSVQRYQAVDNIRRISSRTWDFVDAKLRQLWSPEQISGYLLVNNEPSVSHESIYQRIYADKRRGGTLHKSLRCQKGKRKRYGSNDRRGKIDNRPSIDTRPQVVAERSRYGDWEGDTIIGAHHQQALVTLNERKSRYALIGRVAHKSAQAVADTIIALLAPLADCVHTLTTDNGKEFAHHAHIAKALNTQFYFAHPYCSWERGANENMNGLIRQFFPKKSSFEKVGQNELIFAMNSLNHRPRKCLNFKTPHEVFMKQLQSQHHAVALQG